MKSNNFFISGLVIFLLLILALAIYGGTTDISSSSDMMPYDFVNFTMDIPKGDFLKEDFSGNVTTFSEKNGQFLISFRSDEGAYEDIVDYYKGSNFASVEVIENLTVIHIDGGSYSNTTFQYIVLTADNDKLVMIEGNDDVLLKKMASSVKFYN